MQTGLGSDLSKQDFIQRSVMSSGQLTIGFFIETLLFAVSQTGGFFRQLLSAIGMLNGGQPGKYVRVCDENVSYCFRQGTAFNCNCKAVDRTSICDFSKTNAAARTVLTHELPKLQADPAVLPRRHFGQ